MFTFAVSTEGKNVFTLSIHAKDIAHAINRVQEMCEGLSFKRID